MNPSPYEGLTLVTFSDLKLLFLRNLTKIKSVSIYFWLACIFLMLFRGQYYIAESTFKQASRQNEMGLSLKEAYQQFFSLSAESSTIAIMQSNEVLKDVIEELGMQAVCNPDFFVVKALKRVRDNLVFEFGGSPPDLDTFVFRNVSYPGEKPLKLFLKLTSPVSYQLFGQDKHILGEGKLEQPFSFPTGRITLCKIPKSIKINHLYPLIIQPWAGVVRHARKKLKIAPLKQDKNILKLLFPCRDRFLAAEFVNHVMKSYQKYLKKENDETCEQQLAYLRRREEELTSHYDKALIDHVGYLKDNLRENGFVGVAQEIEILSQPRNLYTSKLFDVDLELQRLHTETDLFMFSVETENDEHLNQLNHVFKKSKKIDEKKAEETALFSKEKKMIANRLETCDLDQKRTEGLLTKSDFKAEFIPPLLIEIQETDQQLHEAAVLIQCLEKKEKIPSFSSLQKDPKSPVSSLVKQIEDSSANFENSETSLLCLREFVNHLAQKRKILEENLTLQKQQSDDFAGLNLRTAQELLAEYTRQRDNLQAQVRELVFLREQLFYPDFEMSSLGGVFNDSITADIIQKASALSLQIKDDSNRSDREQARLQDSLKTQKNFLSQYLFQTIELKKLRSKLLSDKICSLSQTTASLLRYEKKLLTEKLQELNLKMGDLPEKWHRESLLMLKKELGAMMLQGISQLAEAKNLGQHTFQASSKPLDLASPPTRINPPKMIVVSLLSSVFAALGFYGFVFSRNLMKGFPVSVENLKISGFPIGGSLSRYCNAGFSQLCAEDLETLRRLAEFLVSHSKKSNASSAIPLEGSVAACIGGNYPNYVLSLAEILAMRGLKVLYVNCAFDQVHAENMPGLYQYLDNPSMDIPFRRHLTFDLLPSGGMTRHATELIGSAKFWNFLSQMKQKYDIVLLYSSAGAKVAEGHAFLHVSDSIIVTVQQEKKDELLPYVDWAKRKEANCATFVYMNE